MCMCVCVLQPCIPVIPIMLSAPHMYHRSADISCLAHLACDLITITCNLLTYFQEDGHLCSCTPLLLKVCVYTAGARLHYLGPKGRSTQPFFRVLLSLSFGPRGGPRPILEMGWWLLLSASLSHAFVSEHPKELPVLSDDIS